MSETQMVGISSSVKIVQRYILRESLVTVTAVILILVLTTVGVFVADSLSDVARGRIPADIMLSQVGLRLISALSVVLPLAVFLAVLMTVGRLYRDSEMAVLGACGISSLQLVSGLSGFVLSLAAVSGALTLYVSPWAVAKAKAQKAEAQSRIGVAGLQEGRFQELPGGRGVVYVATLDAAEQRFGDVFVQTERGERRDVVRARSGYQYRDESTGERFIALQNGTRTEGNPGEQNYRLIDFERNDLRLPAADVPTASVKQGALSTGDLLADPSRINLAELHWRLGPPFALAILMMLAFTLAKTGPREGLFGRVLMGAAVYVAYANLLGVGRAWLEQGRVPTFVGMWWVHAIFATAAIWMLYRQNVTRSPRAARA